MANPAMLFPNMDTTVPSVIIVKSLVHKGFLVVLSFMMSPPKTVIYQKIRLRYAQTDPIIY
jgi:hypothetical protein